MPTRTPTATVHRLKVTLDGFRPPIWRRVDVPSTITLAELHGVIQAAMGWEDYHLHQFEIDDTLYGVDDGEGWGPPLVEETRTRLGKVATEGARFTYLYDFGDSWEHRVEVEDVVALDPCVAYPRCAAGKRACPPEDCGGVWGYAELLEAQADPRHERHEELHEWVGGPFDPDEFDLDEANTRLGSA